MKIILQTHEGKETVENITSIREFENNVVFATENEIEYDIANDFPTAYKKVEILIEGD